MDEKRKRKEAKAKREVKRIEDAATAIAQRAHQVIPQSNDLDNVTVLLESLADFLENQMTLLEAD